MLLENVFTRLLWSFGVILMLGEELLLGRSPFQPDSTAVETGLNLNKPTR